MSSTIATAYHSDTVYLTSGAWRASYKSKMSLSVKVRDPVVHDGPPVAARPR